MPVVKISPLLNPVDWTKKVGDLDKPYRIGEELKKLYRQFDLLPLDLLDLGNVDSVALAEERDDHIAKGDFAKAHKVLVDLAKAVAAAAKKCEADLKKNDKAPKIAVAAPGAVAAAAGQLLNDVDAALAKALADLKALKSKLAAEEKKEAAAADKSKKDEQAKNAKADEEDDADKLADDKDEKKFREKIKATLVGWFRRVKAEGAPRPKFTVAVLGKTWGVYLAKSAGESEKKVAARLAGLKTGYKHCKGEMYYDPQARVWVFEGPNIPLGRANATSMSLALKPIMGYAPRLRLQKPGERGEDSEGADPDPDEKQDVAGGAPKGPAGVEPVKAFTARLEALRPRIVASAIADKLKPMVAQAGSLAAKGSVDKAQALLGDIEDMLSGKVPKAPPEPPAGNVPKAPPEPPAGAKPGGGAAGLSLVKLGKARLEWAAVRGEALRGIEQLARRIEDEYRNEAEQRAQVAEATKKLRALAAQLKEDLEAQLDRVLNAADPAARTAQMRAAKASLTEVLRVVATDPLMKELDKNELMPDLEIVKPMQEKLREIAAALG